MIFLVSDTIKLDTDKITSVSSYYFNNYKEKGENLIQYLKLDKKEYLGVDTETEGFDAYNKKMLSLQIGDRNNQVVFVWEAIAGSICNYLEQLFKSDISFIFHNAKFDLRFLIVNNIWPKKVICTYLCEQVIYQGYEPQTHPKSLLHLAMKYCGAKLNKDVRGKIHYKGLRDPEVVEYGADDVKYLEDIFKHQYVEIERNELIKTMQLECKFVKVLTYVEMCGIRLNKEKWLKKCEDDLHKLEAIKNKLDEFILSNPQEFGKYIDHQYDMFRDGFTCKINWASSHQVIPLFKSLGLELKTKDKKTGEYKDSVDAKVLKPQKDKHPLIPIYLEFKGMEKTTSTYGYNWIKHINPKTNRIHSQFNQIIDTGRMSSGGKNKATGEEYINLLNIPQDNNIRNCIIPNEGNVFINPDYVGQETLILANKSQETNMIKLINEGGDLHSFVAKNINEKLKDLTDQEIKDNHPKDRQNAKSGGFAIQFGGNGYTISQNLSIPIEDGDRVFNAYFKAFPQLGEYFDWVTNQTMKNGYIITDEIIGRRIYISFLEEYKQIVKQLDNNFWTKYKKHKEEGNIPDNMRQLVRKWASMKSVIRRLSLNYPVQGCGALMMKIAAIYIYDEIERQKKFFKVLIPNIIYDEVLLESPDNEKEFWSEFVCSSMEKAAYIFCKNPVIKAEPNIITEWKK